MRGFMLAVILAVTLAVLPANASGAPDSMKKIGAGEAYYMGFIKVYGAELYTVDPADANRILSPDVSKCLNLTYRVSLKPADFIKGADMVLERQHSREDLDEVRSDIDRLHDAYVGVKKGDSYQLCYDASTSVTTLALNDRELVSIPSRQFGNYYLGIWLAPEKPLSDSLRMDLLGGGPVSKREDTKNG